LPDKKPSITAAEALVKIRSFCDYRDRCHQEVKTKLYELGLWTRDVDHLVSQMFEEGLLNEERYAKSYARGHFYIKKWGRNKIIAELKSRHINERLISRAMQEIDEDDYLKMIEKLILQKRKISSGSKPVIKQKIARYLLQKGYGYTEFSKALDAALSK